MTSKTMLPPPSPIDKRARAEAAGRVAHARGRSGGWLPMHFGSRDPNLGCMWPEVDLDPSRDDDTDRLRRICRERGKLEVL